MIKLRPSAGLAKSSFSLSRISPLVRFSSPVNASHSLVLCPALRPPRRSETRGQFLILQAAPTSGEACGEV